MADVIRQDGPGPLSAIEDPIVAKELRKLWGVVTARSGQLGNQDNAWVTRGELNAAKRELIGKFPENYQRASRQDVGGGVGGGGVGVDLLPLDNVWTGTNKWEGGETLGVNRYRFLGLTSGPITSFTTPNTTLLEAVDYQGLVDIQKSSESSIFHSKAGGNAALFVQHRGGGTAQGDVGVYAIRATAESITTSPANHGNSVAAGYFTTQNVTTNGIGWGVKVDLWHKVVAGYQGGVSYGVEANMFRQNLDGKTVGFHARAGMLGSFSQVNNFAFLASPTAGGSGRFDTVYAGGSDFIGVLGCNYGMDLTYATCDLAAIRIRFNTAIQLNGPQNNVGLKFDPVGKIQFFSDIGPTVAIGNDGSLRVRAGKQIELNDSGVVSVAIKFNPGGAIDFETGGVPMFQFGTGGQLNVLNPSTVATAGALAGYWIISLGGFLRKIPFYSY